MLATIINKLREILKMTQENETHTGKVKWFSAAKGYGFIEQGSDQPDIFFHVNQSADKAAIEKLVGGESVRFKIGIKNGKTNATAVALINNE